MRTLLSTAVITSSLILSAAAQGQQPPAPSPAPAQRPAAAQPAKVTISGCIQTPAPEAPGPGATAAVAPASSKFDLANAKVVGNAPVGTSGTAATATRYKLEGDEKTISPHLNHQVEITGTVSPATAGAAAAAPTLKVDAVKMTSAKCS